MALDPRIAMGVQVPQIPIPDFGNTILTGQNILGQQALNQQRALTLSELLRERQQKLDAEEFVRLYNQKRQGLVPSPAPSVLRQRREAVSTPQVPVSPGGGTETMPALTWPNLDPSQLSFPPQTPLPEFGAAPVTPAMQAEPIVSDVPQAVPSLIPPAPQQPVPVLNPPSAPTTLATPQGRSVAVPGGDTAMTPTPAPMSQTSQAPGFPPYLELAQFGKPGREMYEDYQKAMLGDAQMQKNLEQTGLARLGYAQLMLAVPQNDTMYQPILADLQHKMPELAASLPQTFEPETIAKILKGWQMAASKAKGVQFGTSLHQFYDPVKKQVVVRQVSNAGGLVEPEGAANLIPIGPMMTVDTATGTIVTPRNQPQMPGGVPGGAPAVIPKELGPAAEQTAGGTVRGKETAEYEATFPARKLQAEQALDRLTEKHMQAEQKLDRAIALMKSGNFPTTNRLGEFLSTLGYEPGLDLRATLSSLQAELGLTELVDLKKTSGAGLGQVSDSEGQRLERTIATINPDRQSDASLLHSLETIRNSLRTTRERLNRNYQDEFIERRGQPFSGGQGQGAPPASAPGDQGTTANRKPVSRARAQEALDALNAQLQQAGQPPMTMQQFEEKARANHWQIGR